MNLIEKYKLKSQGYNIYMPAKIIKKMKKDGFKLKGDYNFNDYDYLEFEKNGVIIGIKYQKYYPHISTIIDLQRWQLMPNFDKTYIVLLEKFNDIDQDFINKMNKNHIYQITLDNFLELKIKLRSLKEVNKTYIKNKTNQLENSKKSLLEEIQIIDNELNELNKGII